MENINVKKFFNKILENVTNNLELFKFISSKISGRRCINDFLFHNWPTLHK